MFSLPILACGLNIDRSVRSRSEVASSGPALTTKLELQYFPVDP